MVLGTTRLPLLAAPRVPACPHGHDGPRSSRCPCACCSPRLNRCPCGPLLSGPLRWCFRADLSRRPVALASSCTLWCRRLRLSPPSPVLHGASRPPAGAFPADWSAAPLPAPADLGPHRLVPTTPVAHLFVHHLVPPTEVAITGPPVPAVLVRLPFCPPRSTCLQPLSLCSPPRRRQLVTVFPITGPPCAPRCLRDLHHVLATRPACGPPLVRARPPGAPAPTGPPPPRPQPVPLPPWCCASEIAITGPPLPAALVRLLLALPAPCACGPLSCSPPRRRPPSSSWPTRWSWPAPQLRPEARAGRLLLDHRPVPPTLGPGSADVCLPPLLCGAANRPASPASLSHHRLPASGSTDL